MDKALSEAIGMASEPPVKIQRVGTGRPDADGIWHVRVQIGVAGRTYHGVGRATTQRRAYLDALNICRGRAGLQPVLPLEHSDE